MSERIMICDQAKNCADSAECPHAEEHSSNEYCFLPCERNKEAGKSCISCAEQTTVQPPKLTRKRSAPLYGELLNERELLKMDNHNLRSENDRLRDSLNAYRLASLFGIVALWFLNRKGGGK